MRRIGLFLSAAALFASSATQAAPPRVLEPPIPRAREELPVLRDERLPPSTRQAARDVLDALARDNDTADATALQRELELIEAQDQAHPDPSLKAQRIRQALSRAAARLRNKHNEAEAARARLIEEARFVRQNLPMITSILEKSLAKIPRKALASKEDMAQAWKEGLAETAAQDRAATENRAQGEAKTTWQFDLNACALELTNMTVSLPFGGKTKPVKIPACKVVLAITAAVVAYCESHPESDALICAIDVATNLLRSAKVQNTLRDNGSITGLAMSAAVGLGVRPIREIDLNLSYPEPPPPPATAAEPGQK